MSDLLLHNHFKCLLYYISSTGDRVDISSCLNDISLRLNVIEHLNEVKLNIVIPELSWKQYEYFKSNMFLLQIYYVDIRQFELLILEEKLLAVTITYGYKLNINYLAEQGYGNISLIVTGYFLDMLEIFFKNVSLCLRKDKIPSDYPYLTLNSVNILRYICEKVLNLSSDQVIIDDYLLNRNQLEQVLIPSMNFYHAVNYLNQRYPFFEEGYGIIYMDLNSRFKLLNMLNLINTKSIPSVNMFFLTSLKDNGNAVDGFVVSDQIVYKQMDVISLLNTRHSIRHIGAPIGQLYSSVVQSVDQNYRFSDLSFLSQSPQLLSHIYTNDNTGNLKLGNNIYLSHQLNVHLNIAYLNYYLVQYLIDLPLKVKFYSNNQDFFNNFYLLYGSRIYLRRVTINYYIPSINLDLFAIIEQ